MKYIKSIVPILVQNYYVFGGKCCPKEVLNEKGTEIDTSKNEDNKKKIPEEILKKKQEENLKKINNVKEQKIDEKNIKKIISQNIKIEPPKGDKIYTDIIEKIQKEVEKRNTEEIKDIPVTDKGKVKYKSIIDEFKKDTCVGLQNIGATCYMNATLQCFSHIPQFVDYFKYHHNSKFDDKNTLSSSFKTLIDNLWNKDSIGKYYVPNDFKNKISEMNDLFKGVAANDSKDLVNFIIMTLHEELNNPNKNYKPNSNYINQGNRNEVFNAFINQFTNQYRSKISDLFYGVNCSITQCCNCKNQLFNYQAYFFLVFPLEEVRKYNKSMCDILNTYSNNQYYNYYYKQQMYNNISTNTVTIYDCFNYDTKINTMSGENSMYCNYCNNTCPSNMKTVLTTGPEVLILILNRGKGIEYNVKLLFEETLDLTNYIEYNNVGAKYKLIGVITHIGESGMGGHFIAYCRDPKTNEWNKFNDAIVNKVTNFQQEVIDFAMPYVLFYEKIKEK